MLSQTTLGSILRFDSELFGGGKIMGFGTICGSLGYTRKRSLSTDSPDMADVRRIKLRKTVRGGTYGLRDTQNEDH